MKTKLFAATATVVMLLAMLSAVFAGGMAAFAAEEEVDLIQAANGVYECTYSLTDGYEEGSQGGTMIRSNFDDTVVIEKSGEVYYMCFTQLSAQYMEDMYLSIGGMRLGWVIAAEYEEEGDAITNTVRTFAYTIAEEDITKQIDISVVITAMNNRRMSFGITLNISQATVSDADTDDSLELPARFVPVISTNASDGTISQGSTYTIPAAEADFGEVTYAVYYGENREEVAVEDGAFVAENAGYYYLVYTATSEEYLTSEGNPAQSTLEISLYATASGGTQSGTTYDHTLGDITDENGSVSGYAYIEGVVLTSGDTYDEVTDLLGDGYSAYRVIRFELVGSDGQSVALSGEVTVSLAVPSTYERSKVRVFRYDGTSLTEMRGSMSGGSFVFDADTLGIFVIAQTGDGNGLPAWAVGVIVAACVVVVGVVVAVVVIKKRKRA